MTTPDPTRPTSADARPTGAEPGSPPPHEGRMRILVIHQQFLRADEGGGSRFNEFTRLWAEAGHEVYVIAGQTSYATGERPRLYHRHLAYREQLPGVTVLRVYTPEARMSSFLSRTWNFLCFMLSATWAGLLLVPRPDVVIATSPQLIVAVPGILAARMRRCPLIFEVRDLWPETGITMGAIRPRSAFGRALFWLEALAYRRAAAINVLTPAFRDSIVRRRLARPEKIHFIPNGAYLMGAAFAEERAEARRRLGWEDKFVVLYAGAHGVANDLGQLVRAAERLRDHPHILFVTVGTGGTLAELQAEAARVGLTNLRFLGPVPKQHMPELLAAADAGAAILLRCETFKTVYPNKVLDYMSARLPVLLAIDGVARELVETARAGLYAEPGDTEALCQAVLQLQSRPAEAEAMGARGRAYVQAHFDHTVLARNYLALMHEVIAARAPAASR